MPKVSFEVWEQNYQLYLKQIFHIFLQNIFKNSIGYKETDYSYLYPEFCHLVYTQSSKKISIYEI